MPAYTVSAWFGGASRRAGAKDTQPDKPNGKVEAPAGRQGPASTIEKPSGEPACDADAGEAVQAKTWATWIFEDLAVQFFVFTFTLQLWCWLFFGVLLYAAPLLRLPLLGYLAWYTVGPASDLSRCLAKWSPYPLRRAPWHKYIASYFPYHLVRASEPLDPQRRYVFCFHPHGLVTIGAWVAFCTEALGFSRKFPGIDLHCLTLASNLRTPFLRDYLLGHGLGDCSRPSCMRLLARGSGSAIFLAVGGASETLLVRPGTFDLCLRRRKGFVRVALQAGADLVPVISFGENDQYRCLNSLPESSALRRFQRACQRVMGFTCPVAIGKGPLGLGYGLLPYRVPTTVVTGPPVPVEKWEGHTNSAKFDERVDELHARYCDALLTLFHRHKEQYAPCRKSDMRLVE